MKQVPLHLLQHGGKCSGTCLCAKTREGKCHGTCPKPKANATALAVLLEQVPWHLLLLWGKCRGICFGSGFEGASAVALASVVERLVVVIVIAIEVAIEAAQGILLVVQ